jgi:hypothetical protein
MSEKIYNILVIVSLSDDKVETLWLDNDGKFSTNRDNSKILLDEESKVLIEELKTTNDFVMVGRFPAELDWKSKEGETLSCPTKNKLESLLKKYLENEEYEKACVVRDKLRIYNS